MTQVRLEGGPYDGYVGAGDPEQAAVKVIVRRCPGHGCRCSSKRLHWRPWPSKMPMGPTCAVYRLVGLLDGGLLYRFDNMLDPKLRIAREKATA